jgi:hypothetical protein
MKKLLVYSAVLAMAVFGIVHFTSNVSAGTSDCAPSGKCQETCTGFETSGHCADKCADPTWTLQGYDKETGAAICVPPPTGCPYADRVPLGPECDKLAPQPAVYTPPVIVPGFVGK